MRLLPVLFGWALLGLPLSAEDWGRVMYLGDSITQGINTGSWRWDFHKVLVDNGVTYEEVGYNRDNFQRGRGNGVDLAGESYRGVPFRNVHSAHEGGCSWQYLNGGGDRYEQKLADGSTMELTTRCGPKYSGHRVAELAHTYHADTYIMLLGINDILQDFIQDGHILAGPQMQRALRSILGAVREGAGYRFCGDGTMDGVADALQGAKRVVVLSLVPPAGNWCGPAEHNAIADFNEFYEQWAVKRGFTFARIGEGTVDVSRTPEDRYGALVGGRQRVDWIHPGPQTNLIMAGNLAKTLGLSGRSAGLPRRAATAENGFHRPTAPAEGDMTLELSAPRVGDGAPGGRNTADGLRVQLTARGKSAVLHISESAIAWGEGKEKETLCSRDMSANTEPLRVAVTADGCYVWLGEQLIGEALPAAGAPQHEAVSVSASGRLSADSGEVLVGDGAFAPAVPAPAAS